MFLFSSKKSKFSYLILFEKKRGLNLKSRKPLDEKALQQQSKNK